mmetsp:Transcript_22995/g.26614  ORF Transcript_22995/g.26614 Transcript_22995/m.26614 type:complete len:265 (+) Transcript_22995:76-870(+)|eukprot:CAMPEP_0171013852 /NCGR_PEP_ID=MMETSP0736-20130129/24670_1 /TAXON_ID=186038 /ORGANISM="Fragilariopsis kerguelensis, Strain L26-C5" /LENGTH=264 /DNA_ID=CAMNT_0011447749 /DNA_START=47 /DNA_END=841 /DNA_ORIENTATION=-
MSCSITNNDLSTPLLTVEEKANTSTAAEASKDTDDGEGDGDDDDGSRNTNEPTITITDTTTTTTSDDDDDDDTITDSSNQEKVDKEKEKGKNKRFYFTAEEENIQAEITASYDKKNRKHDRRNSGHGDGNTELSEQSFEVMVMSTFNNTSTKTELQLMTKDNGNPNDSDDLCPDKESRSMGRQLGIGCSTTIMAAGCGVTVGLLTGPFFPLGIVIGGAIGGTTSSLIMKQREKNKQRQWEKHHFNEYALNYSSLAKNRSDAVLL